MIKDVATGAALRPVCDGEALRRRDRPEPEPMLAGLQVELENDDALRLDWKWEDEVDVWA